VRRQFLLRAARIHLLIQLVSERLDGVLHPPVGRRKLRPRRGQQCERGQFLGGQVISPVESPEGVTVLPQTHQHQQPRSEMQVLVVLQGKEDVRPRFDAKTHSQLSPERIV